MFGEERLLAYYEQFLKEFQKDRKIGQKLPTVINYIENHKNRAAYTVECLSQEAHLKRIHVDSFFKIVLKDQ
jgi:hypothetical protein